MSVVQNGITKEIQSLKDSKLNANDAISALSKLTEEAKKLAEENVEKANATGSVDERIQFLVSALQGVLNLIEDTSERIRDDVEKIDIQTEALQDILQKVKSLEDEEKKSYSSGNDE
ncbi:MAG: hypothetical protein CBC29_05715 [Methylococcaceae bacterium TMED69]|nr:MAG: hypothetical protein CBC29_05715 [Methylococcaceae bacterium TMED69]|tara:strand:+ start:281 stop:631 length:351 start_codon:yes stop_codon:yes gene_type:complete